MISALSVHLKVQLIIFPVNFPSLDIEKNSLQHLKDVLKFSSTFSIA